MAYYSKECSDGRYDDCTDILCDHPMCGQREKEDICPDCLGTGEVEVGEFDDIETKKCHCQLEKIDDDDA